MPLTRLAVAMPRVLALALALALSTTGTRARPVQVAADPVYLNPDAREQTQVGQLRFLAGLRLRSDDREFGGLSGHTILDDGTTWYAISDEGRWLVGRLTFDSDDVVTGLADVHMEMLRSESGQPLKATRDKRFVDAEALRRTASGEFLVSFEIRHRILRYPADGGLAGRPTVMPAPRTMLTGPRNGGLEALAVLPSGQILAMTESMGDDQGRLAGWLIDGAAWKPLGLRPTGLYRPTDMIALPNGDVLLLERRFTVAGGPAARISLIPAAGIAPGATLESRTIGEMALPMSVDNFEGLALRPDRRNGWQLFILSDDNFNPLQRTLLLQFHLPADVLSE